MEYKQFLESCDFIKVPFGNVLLDSSAFAGYLLRSKLYLCIAFLLQADSQWRKLQDRLEVDERCARLEKIDRLDIFLVIFYLHL